MKIFLKMVEVTLPKTLKRLLEYLWIEVQLGEYAITYWLIL